MRFNDGMSYLVVGIVIGSILTAALLNCQPV